MANEQSSVEGTMKDTSAERNVSLIDLTSDDEADQIKEMVWEKLKENSPIDWWMDTGASHHFCPYKELFATYEEVDNQEIMSRNGTSSKTSGIGNVTLKMASGKTITLIDVLHAPDMRRNFVSWSKLSMSGYGMMCEWEWMELFKDHEYVGVCHLVGNMFRLDTIPTYCDL